MLNVRPLRTVIFRAILIGSASLLATGCSSSNSDVDSSKPVDLHTGPGQVTFYVAGMNQRLKIL